MYVVFRSRRDNNKYTVPDVSFGIERSAIRKGKNFGRSNGMKEAGVVVYDELDNDGAKCWIRFDMYSVYCDCICSA
jgi:hypothetical protein